MRLPEKKGVGSVVEDTHHDRLFGHVIYLATQVERVK